VALVVAVAVLTAAAASAYTSMFRFQYCAGIPSDKERLACYDNYALETGLKPPSEDLGLSASQMQFGRWTVRTETLAPAGTSSVFAFTEGKAAVFGIDGRPAVPTLVARCREGATELYVAFSPGFPAQAGPIDHSVLYYKPKKSDNNPATMPGTDPAEQRVAATVRMDGGNPVEMFMRRSEDGLGFFFPNPVSNLTQMRRHESLDFTYSPKGHGQMTINFPLDGMGEAIRPLRDACSW
jgi:type VI secretion system protein VasI